MQPIQRRQGAIIIGCDFHTWFQQIAMLEVTTGELVERRLEHRPAPFLRALVENAQPSLLG
jgi:hypothetical protein